VRRAESGIIDQMNACGAKTLLWQPRAPSATFRSRWNAADAISRVFAPVSRKFPESPENRRCHRAIRRAFLAQCGRFARLERELGMKRPIYARLEIQRDEENLADAHRHSTRASE